MALAVNSVAGYNANTMSALFDELEKQARLLSPQEKAELARLLIEELDPASDEEAEEIWVAEAQRRYEAYAQGQLESRPGDEVLSRVRTRLK
jgi:putative addiction module component (TIGR02574 family)